MPTQPFHIAEMQHDKPLNEQVEYLTNELAKTQKILRYLLNGQIDFENIQARGIKAENIEAGAITTNELAAGSVTTDILAAGAVTADKMTVNELSAITANLGVVTAGAILSNTIINVGTDANVGRYLNLNVDDFNADGGVRFIKNGAVIAEIDVYNSDLSISSNGYVTLNGGSGSYANGGRIAVEGISVGISVMGGDGVTPMNLIFTGGTLRQVT